MNDILNNAYFAYFISKNEHKDFSEHTPFGEYIVSHTKNTDILTAENSNKKVLIIGLCVDAHAQIKRNDIAQFLASSDFDNPKDLYRLCDRFSGKHIIMLEIDGKYYLWGDASCYLPVNYTFANGNFCAGCTDKMVADYLGFDISPISKEIKYSGKSYMQLPYNITMYDEIKALLANQYLDIDAEKYIRIKLDVKRNSSKEHIDSVLKNTYELTQNTAKEYCEYYDFACPLTAGYDSRVVFAVMESIGKLRYAYTMKHKNFTDKTPDIAIPKKITSDREIPYIIKEDIETPEDIKKFVFDFLGDWTSEIMIDYAYTSKSIVKDDSILSGQIIEQLGNHSVVKGIPDCFVNARLAQLKVMNKSPYYKEETKKHIKEWKNAGEKYFGDLLAWESRVSRWATQNEMLYSLIGLNILNFFNCRELILQYISLPIKFRVNRGVHNYFYKTADSGLLNYQFNMGKVSLPKKCVHLFKKVIKRL